MTRIDHLVITHYHGDHHGGVEILAENVPIGRVYDHGTSIEAGRPNVDAFMERYTEITSRFGRTIVRPGDRIPFAGVDVLVVTSHGDIIFTVTNTRNGFTKNVRGTAVEDSHVKRGKSWRRRRSQSEVQRSGSVGWQHGLFA